MTSGKDDPVELWLRIADDALIAARHLISIGNTRGAANRLYYACFYAVTAALAPLQLSSNKHTGIRSFFNRYLVNAGLVSREDGNLYNKLFATRLDADYDQTIEIELEGLEELLPQCERFLSRVGALAKEKNTE